MTRIHVVLASTRSGRFGERVASWVMDRTRVRQDVEAELVDLRDYPLPMFDEDAPPAAAPRTYPNEPVARWGAKVDAADGFLVLVPEYNRGYPATLKNALDSLFVEFHRKPIACVGYGSVGAARSIEQLRLVAIELGMVPIPRAVHITRDLMAPARMAEDFRPELLAPLDDELDRVVAELDWWATALRPLRNGSGAAGILAASNQSPS